MRSISKTSKGMFDTGLTTNFMQIKDKNENKHNIKIKGIENSSICEFFDEYSRVIPKVEDYESNEYDHVFRHNLNTSLNIQDVFSQKNINIL